MTPTPDSSWWRRAYRAAVPTSLRLALAYLRRPGRFGLVDRPAYHDDGFATQHLPSFREDPKFQESYRAGRATGALDGLGIDIEWRAHVACWCAGQAVRLEGDFVECGVGRGLLSRTIVGHLEFERVPKTFYLVDTYDGLAEEFIRPDEDRSALIRSTNHIYRGNYERVVATFKGYPNVKVIRGAVPPVLAQVDVPKVAYLSLDMNNAEPEIRAAEFFWPKLVPGGIVLLDDFAYSEYFASQRKAFTEFSRRHDAPILVLPTGQGLMVKR